MCNDSYCHARDHRDNKGHPGLASSLEGWTYIHTILCSSGILDSNFCTGPAASGYILPIIVLAFSGSQELTKICSFMWGLISAGGIGSNPTVGNTNCDYQIGFQTVITRLDLKL